MSESRWKKSYSPVLGANIRKTPNTITALTLDDEITKG